MVFYGWGVFKGSKLWQLVHMWNKIEDMRNLAQTVLRIGLKSNSLQCRQSLSTPCARLSKQHQHWNSNPTLPTSWHAPAAAAKVISSDRMPGAEKDWCLDSSKLFGVQGDQRSKPLIDFPNPPRSSENRDVNSTSRPLPRPLNSFNIFTASSHRWLHAIRAALWPELVVAIRTCIAWAMSKLPRFIHYHLSKFWKHRTHLKNGSYWLYHCIGAY